MQREYDAIEARQAQAVAIAQGTAAEAERFCRAAGVGYPCVGDPGKDSYRSYGLPRGGLKEIIIDPMRAGNQALQEGHSVSLRGSLMRHSDWFQLPGLAIVDRAGILRYLHRSRHADDLPELASVLSVLDSLSR